MARLAIFPFDGSGTFQRLLVDNIATQSLGTIQTTTPSGTISFVMNGGASPSYQAQTFLLAQQVQQLLDAFILSGDNFIDLSSKLPLQMFQAQGGTNTSPSYKMTTGTPVYIYGAGFVPGTEATLTNAAATVTLPVKLTLISPGLVYFIAPDNTVPPYNGLDTADTNVLTFINPNGTSFKSSSATITFTVGWT